MPMVSIDHFRQEIRAQMSRAASHGATFILINGGELRRKLRGDEASVEACSKAMRAELNPGDIVLIEASPGVGMTIRYMLPRG
jgi:hypothetical protein